MNALTLCDMPKKVAVPFSRLVQAGQVDEESVAAVLDAGKLDPSVSGDPSKLLAFLAGYSSMQAGGVPVKDTIRMSKDQKRRINIGWSPRRWR
ncbi:MAG: hypothetical protein JXR29_05740, partial [Methylothermaceae bacterium]|nr:hypothetical protein [Methylothermaceae bacterium]